MALKLSPDLSLPDEAVTQAFAILARRGAGKTYAASVMAEEMLKAGFPIVWLDPLGVAWGLRSKHPIVILGGDRADVPIEPTAGRVIADFVVSERVPVIVDVSEFGENQMRGFVYEFADQFYRQNRDPIHWFIDEADEFAPQQATGRGNTGKCLSAIQNICRRGRARGIGVCLITQRSAVLSKSVLSQTEGLFAMQTTHPKDLKAIEEWVEYHGFEKDEKTELMHSIPKLQQGEAYFYSPGWLQTFKRIRIRKRESFDSSATPKPGQRKTAPRALADVDLSAISQALEQTITDAKANDPKELQKRIAALERDKAGLQREVKSLQGKIDRLKDKAPRAAPAGDGPGQDWAVKTLERVHKTITTALDKSPGADVSRRRIEFPETRRAARDPSPEAPHTNGKLPPGEHAILRAVAQYPAGAGREQLTVLTGYKRSSRDAYIQRLKGKGFIMQEGAALTATEAGIEHLGTDFEPLPTGKALREYWMNRLPPGETAILQALMVRYPDAVDRTELEVVTGYKRSSRDAYIQRLKARRLVETPTAGEVRASDILFS